ncbi:MAG: REP-associated tyrosine transposase [Candidatus Acidiferrales bacterium]
MPKNLKRRYGTGNLHFIAFSCYRRLPFLRTARARNVFLIVLNDLRGRYQFAIVGYVVMPEHVHLLLSEPKKGDPSLVMQVLKQRVSRRLRSRTRATNSARQLSLWHEGSFAAHRSFWQRRFYDFNVWSRKKRTEKLHYMHMNPVKRGLVEDAKLWVWSSYRFYQYGEQSLCTPDGLLTP